ncbi:MAG: MATE family efflux transporter, partial [Clostridiales bacterium]|nr:MATE family efflux transporter [Clostridiales bacterium]
IILSLTIGTVIAVAAHILSDPLLRLIGTPDNIIELSSSYVNILHYGVPFQMLSNNFTAISRAVGESRKPLIFYIISVIINFAFDMIFVKGLGLGVEGAAAATLVSHISASILVGIYVLKFNRDVDIKKSDLKPNIKISANQIKLGIPVSLQFTITSIGSMCLQSVVNSFGSNVIAGFTAASKVENLTNLPMSGLGVATQTFVGQNYGAKNYKRITDSVKKILILDIAVSVLMSILLVTVGPHLVSLFMSERNDEIAFAAGQYLIATAECYSLVALLFVMRNTLQGLGFTYANMIAGAGEFCGRIAVAFILKPLIGFKAVCYASPVAWLIADIPLVIIYIKKSQQLKKAQQEQIGKPQSADIASGAEQ